MGEWVLWPTTIILGAVMVGIICIALQRHWYEKYRHRHYLDQEEIYGSE